MKSNLQLSLFSYSIETLLTRVQSNEFSNFLHILYLLLMNYFEYLVYWHGKSYLIFKPYTIPGHTLKCDTLITCIELCSSSDTQVSWPWLHSRVLAVLMLAYEIWSNEHLAVNLINNSGNWKEKERIQSNQLCSFCLRKKSMGNPVSCMTISLFSTSSHAVHAYRLHCCLESWNSRSPVYELEWLLTWSRRMTIAS